MMRSGDSALTTGGFPPTQWSMVVAAGGDSTGAAGVALEQLCRLYWCPLYVFARHRGHAPAEAEDLTQGFFEDLIASGLIARADGERGRFRSFLLGAFKHFMRDERRRSAALKRGGGARMGPIEVCGGEGQLADELASGESPDAVYDRQWALSLLGEAFRQLETEHGESGRVDLFRQLRPFIEGDHDGATYAEAARVLGTTEGTIKVTVHRLRRRFRELLRFLVLQTLTDPLQVEEELRHLIAALRRV